MLIERQVAPALLMLGGALVVPEAFSAFKGLPSPPSTTALMIGDLLAGLGLFMSFMLYLDQAQHVFWRALIMLLLGTLTLLFVAGTALVAFRAGGTATILPALSALAPLLGAGAALYTLRRDAPGG